MKPTLNLLVIAGLLAGFALSANVALAGDISLEGAWARATSPVAKSGGAFMTIHNRGSIADRLVTAKSDVSGKTEIHLTKLENGIMLMQEVDGVDIPANGKAKLKPGAHHIMFMGLKQPLVEGMTFPITLTFEKGGEVNVTVSVKPIGAGMEHMKDHGHGHEKNAPAMNHDRMHRH